MIVNRDPLSLTPRLLTVARGGWLWLAVGSGTLARGARRVSACWHSCRKCCSSTPVSARCARSITPRMLIQQLVLHSVCPHSVKVYPMDWHLCSSTALVSCAVRAGVVSVCTCAVRQCPPHGGCSLTALGSCYHTLCVYPVVTGIPKQRLKGLVAP